MVVAEADREGLEAQIDALVDEIPTVGSFAPDDATAMLLVNDLATQLHPYSTIAGRYGLTLGQLVEWIKQPEVRRRIKQRRAAWQSDAALTERNRALYGVISLDAAPVLDQILHDKTAPAASRLEAFKILGKFAGLEGNPREAQGQPGVAGAQFSVSISFSGGRVETIAPGGPVLEGEAA